MPSPEDAPATASQSPGYAGDVCEKRATRSFRWLLAGVFFVALTLRLLFIMDAQFPKAIHGDAVQYVCYAWNLVNKATFSMAFPSATIATPDSFRGPGYPLMLAPLVWIAQGSTAWIGWALLLQALIGSATAALTAMWLRKRLPVPLAACAGLLVALWPHMVTTCAYLVTETLTGFIIMLGLVASGKAVSARSFGYAAAAGCIWGFAYLVNPICLALPLLVLPWLWRIGGRRQALALMLVFVMFPIGWGARNATLASANSSSQRALANFVEGSWPDFLDAYNSRNAASEPAKIMDEVAREEKAMASDPRAGFRFWWSRMSMQPSRYLAWYALEKPWLLWDWAIRIGNGDIYLYPVTRSPFERFGILKMLKQGAQAINPALFVLACACAFMMLVDLARRGVSSRNFILAATALIFIYLTAVHAVLQAEPRYSIAYRPLEFVLAFGALGLFARRVTALRRKLPAKGAAR